MPISVSEDACVGVDTAKYAVKCPLECFVPPHYATERPYHEHRRRNVPYCPHARAGRHIALKRRRNPSSALFASEDAEGDTADTLEKWGSAATFGVVKGPIVKEGWLVSHLGQWRRVVGRSVRNNVAFLSFYGGLQAATAAGRSVCVIFHQADAPISKAAEDDEDYDDGNEWNDQDD